MRYKPYFLPQVHAPYDAVLQKLDDEDIDYTSVEVDPNDLTPLQGITFSDEVGGVNVDDMNPIWISSDMQVLDGHHRMVRALLDDIPIKCIKINMNYKDACRLLNKIQDIYEYEEAQGLEEVQVQDTINYYGEDDNQFLNSLEEDNIATQTEKTPNKNEKTIIGYRKEPIRENSVVGNFFTLKPVDGYDKYEIDFIVSKPDSISPIAIQVTLNLSEDSILEREIRGFSLLEKKYPGIKKIIITKETYNKKIKNIQVVTLLDWLLKKH